MTATRPAGIAAPDIAKLPFNERLRLAIKATIPKVAPEIGAQLRQLLDPGALTVAGGVLVVWAGLHFTGAGEIADAAVLAVGWLALGGAALQAGRRLFAFAIGVRQAKSPSDIDQAAANLAAAIGLLGVQAVLTMLLHAAPEAFRKPYNMPHSNWNKRFSLGSPPVSPDGRWTYMPTVKAVDPADLGGALGATTVWGDIEIASNLPATDARATLLHEQVHAFLTPKLYLLREARIQIAQQGYSKSFLLRYLEEALAETYALLRTRGLDMNELVVSLRFPISSSSYEITAADMKGEAGATLLGPINVGGQVWHAWLGGRRR